jgi:hypothetical protein
LPKALAWAAWILLLSSITVLGVRITPRRLSRFWQQLDLGTDICAQPLEESDELKIVDDLGDALREQRDRLRRAIQLSVALGLAGLGAAALGFVLDKAFFSG